MCWSRFGMGVLTGGALLGAGVLAASPASAAETIELRFDWGPELTVLRDVESVPGTGAPASSAEMRREPPGMRYRFVATRQTSGEHELRVIDFVLRVGLADVLVPQEAPMRRVIDALAPGIRVDAQGAFVGLLDPEAATSVFQDEPAVLESRLKDRPPEIQQEARAQFEEMRSAESIAARARLPWSESVGFWSGRSLEVGRVYTESAEERYLPMASSRGPVRVERRWSARGRVSCDESPVAAGVAASAVGECVRLSLRSTYTPLSPPVASRVEGQREPRFESEIDLVTEPATLRPRRAQSTWRMRSRDAAGAESVRVLQDNRMRWTYGPVARVALTGTLPPSDPLPGPLVEPANLKPKPVWAAGTPEKAYLDYVAAVDRAEWSVATSLLHPEFLQRITRRIRGKEGVRFSDELRRALVGDELTLEQVDALGDEALMALVSARTARAARPPGVGAVALARVGVETIALGHVEDREGRIHVVLTQENYRMPAEYRSQSFTVVMVPADERTSGAMDDAAPPRERCEPKRDVHRCWRVWRDPRTEFDAVSRARMRLSAPGTRAGGAGWAGAMGMAPGSAAPIPAVPTDAAP